MEATKAQNGTAAYLARVWPRLESAGYTWLDAGPAFAGAAHHKRFQATKFGMCETFFVFRELPRRRGALDAFMKEANRWTYANRRVGLPRGLFAVVATFGVALAQSVDEGVAQSVRDEQPRKHWGAVEMPVVYDAQSNRLVYYEKTPFWGLAYWRGLRKQITDLLSP